MKHLNEKRIIITRANLPASMTLGYLAEFINESLYRFANTSPEFGSITETTPVRVLGPLDNDERHADNIPLKRKPKHGDGLHGTVKKELRAGSFPKGTIFDRDYEGDGLPPYPLKEFLLMEEPDRRIAIEYSRSEMFRRFARCCPQCSACRVEESGKKLQPYHLWCIRFYITVARDGNCRHHDSFITKGLVPDAPEQM